MAFKDNITKREVVQSLAARQKHSKIIQLNERWPRSPVAGALKDNITERGWARLPCCKGMDVKDNISDREMG